MGLVFQKMKRRIPVENETEEARFIPQAEIPRLLTISEEREEEEEEEDLSSTNTSVYIIDSEVIWL